MIDTQQLNPFYFILLELILYCFILYRSRIYLKHFKILDHKIVQNTLHSIYQLKKDFLFHRDKEEIIYRMNDAYQMKQIILSFLFDFIGNVILLLSTFLFLIFYHPAFILFFLFMIPIFIFSYYHLKKHQHFIEKKRKDEYLFFDKLRKDISTHSLDESHYLTCHNFLFNYQKIDFLMEKNKCILLMKGERPFFDDLYELDRHPRYDTIYEIRNKETIRNRHDHAKYMRENKKEIQYHLQLKQMGIKGTPIILKQHNFYPSDMKKFKVVGNEDTMINDLD